MPNLPGELLSDRGASKETTSPITALVSPPMTEDVMSGVTNFTMSSGRPAMLRYPLGEVNSAAGEVHMRHSWNLAVELELRGLRGAIAVSDGDRTEPQIEERAMVSMAKFSLVFADTSYEELYKLRSTMQLQHASLAAYVMLLIHSIYALYGSVMPGHRMPVLEWGATPNAAYNLYWLSVQFSALALLIVLPVFKRREAWRCRLRCRAGGAFVRSERFAAAYFGLVVWLQCLCGNRARTAELLGHRPEDVFGTGESGDGELLLHAALILALLSAQAHIRFRTLLLPGASAALAYPVSTLSTPSGREGLPRHVMSSVMLALVVVSILAGQRQAEVTRRRNLLHEIECRSQSSRLREEKEKGAQRAQKLKESKEVQFKLWQAVKKTRALKVVSGTTIPGPVDPTEVASRPTPPDRIAETRTPNENLNAALPEGVATDWAAVDRAVSRIRDPAYSLKEFHEDMVAAFPELALYTFCPGAGDGDEEGDGEGDGPAEELLSSGRSRLQEMARTFGALYAVYWLMRLGVDGEQGLCFGYSDDFAIRPVPEPPRPGGKPPKECGAMSAEERQIHFYYTFPWRECQWLVNAAGLFQPGLGYHGADAPRVNPGRLKAMLALTAIHDVMKNETICPTVQGHHAPFRNYRAGQVIHDHDVALDYVMTFYGHVLPSYGGLDAGSRRLLCFTQGKMGFNNGWLVQGEAPPGTLFHTMRQVIRDGKANSADVAFYFVHWVTDLAGAEPTPLRGSEKFVQQFPMPVLVSFFRSFPFVWKLGAMTETQVFQEYLRTRWREAALGPLPAGEESVALMRLALQVQGLEEDLHGTFHSLCPRDQETLVDELSRSGLPGQYYEGLSPRPGSPALLVYYGPAFLRQNGDSLCLALSILAEVYRQGRKLFPLAGEGFEAQEVRLPGAITEPPMQAAPPAGSPCIHTASIRIEQLKDLAATDITRPTSGTACSKGFFLVRKSDLEAVVEQKPLRTINEMVDEGVNFAYLNFAPT